MASKIAEKIFEGDPEAMTQGLARAWLKQHPNIDKPHAFDDSRFRHSWAAKCGRALQYEIEGQPYSNPIGVESLWVFRTGTLVHDEWQTALDSAFPECDVRLEYGVRSPDVSGSGSLDALITFPDDNTQVVELKSINGFGFKKMIGGEGPRHSALVQLALNAHATNQELGHNIGGWLIYFALENVSVGQASKYGVDGVGRFMKVRYYTQAELEAIAAPEIKRVRKILEVLDANDFVPGAPGYTYVPRMIPDPQIPDGAVITDPSKGTWQVLDANGGVLDVGKTWHCDYCSYNALCIEDGP